MSTSGGAATTESEYAREVRLGLVLYGGVSLAVYIGGVTQELHSAVRGRGIYGLLKKLLKADITVDVISGTSAGGVNGVLLATALANGAELEGLDRLWREHGDFAKLMRKPSEPNPPSLLDGKGYFQPRLEEAFARILESSGRAEPIESMDLFVTATDYHGQLSWTLDDLSKVIEMKDHRRVFTLKHRAGRRGDLNVALAEFKEGEKEKWINALATVSRSTAAFPGAFEPVEVAEDEHGRGKDRPLESHLLLHDWSRSRSTRAFALLDGGVLDNKPFTHTLRAIYRRTADRRVERRLLYVEPDPEHFKHPDPNEKDDALHVPDFLEVIGGALSQLPMYETIADDLASLAEHNAQVARYQELIDEVQLDAAHTNANEAGGTFRKKVYDKARVQAYVEGFLKCVFAARERDGDARVVDSQLPVDAQRDRLALLANLLKPKQAEEAEKFLALHDLDFPVRRLFAVTYKLYDRIYPNEGPPTADPGQGRQLLRALNKHLQLYKIIERVETTWRERIACRPEIVADPVDAQKVREMLAQGLNALFTPSADVTTWVAGFDPREVTQKQLDAFSELLKKSAGGGPGLLAALEAAERRTLQDARFAAVHEAAAKDYDRFEKLDLLTYPFEAMAHLEQKDHIHLLRISPDNAKLGFCQLPAYDKITGETLGHFGAFMKKSWRANDFLWGRLDGMTLLLQNLLPLDKLQKYIEEAGLTEADVVAAFPSYAQQKAALPTADFPLVEWLTRKQPAPPDKGLEALAYAAQAEIIRAGFPDQIEDSVTQGAQWGTVPTPDGAPPTATLDAHVAQWAASQVASLVKDAKAQQPGPAPGVDAVEAFKKYKVGTEGLSQLPVLVLMGIVGQAGLVVTRLLQQGLRRRLPDVLTKAVAPLLWLARGVASFVYLFATTERIHPVRNALRVASVVLLLVGVLKSSVWLKSGEPEGLSLIWASVFLIVPAGYLLLDSLLAYGATLRWFGGGALVLAGAALVAGYGWKKYEWLAAWLGSFNVPADLLTQVALFAPLGLLILGWVLLTLAEPSEQGPAAKK